MEKSETIGTLAAALAKAQSEIRPALFDAINPHFKSKFASFRSCMEAVREPLSKNGLAIVQSVNTSMSESILETVLIHSSGEWVSSKMVLKPAKPDMQALGSAITYAKRYALCALVGVVSDDDDDGNASVESPKEKPQLSAPKALEVTPPKPVEYVIPKGKHAGKAPWMLSDIELNQFFTEVEIFTQDPGNEKNQNLWQLFDELGSELAKRGKK
jgi:hypothetical protein